MSLYGEKFKVGGIPCGLVLRGPTNGEYRVVFEREYASLEQIEALNWDPPAIEGDCILPDGYGFSVEEISYSSKTYCFTVSLKVAEQYLGDMAGYQAQVSELQGEVAQKDEEIAQKDSTITEQTATIQAQEKEIQDLEAAGTAEGLKDDLNAAYKEGVESVG